MNALYLSSVSFKVSSSVAILFYVLLSREYIYPKDFSQNNLIILSFQNIKTLLNSRSEIKKGIG
jgi:hypothetical protein